MDKKNTMLLTVIAVATLLVAVVGATFAYFTATNSATGTTNVTTTTETLGAVTITNPTAGLHLSLKAAQMAVDTKGTSYYATNGSEGYSATAIAAPIARLGITGGETSTEYEISFAITPVKSKLVQAGDATITFTLGDGVTMTGTSGEISDYITVTSGAEIDYASLLDEYQVKYTATGNVTDVDLVKVDVKFTNRDVEQDYLAGETLTTSFTNSGMKVVVK